MHGMILQGGLRTSLFSFHLGSQRSGVRLARLCFPAIAAVLSIAASSAYGGGAAAYRLISCYNAVLDPSAQFFVLDMEGDGNDELVVADPRLGSVLIRRWGVDPRDPTRLHLYENQDIQVNLTPPGVLSPVMGDVTGDGRIDLFVTSQVTECLASGDSTTALSVACYAPVSPLCTLGPFLSGCSRRVENSVGLVSLLATTDLNGDGRADVLLFHYPFDTGCENRSVRAYDARSGRELWRLDTPTPPGDAIVLEPDLNRRQQPMLILGAHACGNGFRIGDWSDSESCVTGISHSGSLLWRTRIGGKGTGTRLTLADRDGDGAPEPYVTLQGQRDEAGGEPKPQLFGLDPTTGSLTPFMLPEYAHGLVAVDLDGRRGDEILLVGRDQILYALGRHFEVVWTFRDDRVRTVIACRDLEGDGRSEILCDCGDILRILDTHGQELVQTGLSGVAPLTRAACASIGENNYLIVRQGDQIKYLRLERLPGNVSAWLWILGTSLVFVVGLVCVRILRTSACREFGDAHWELRHGGGGAPFVTILRLDQLLASWRVVSEQGGVRASPVPGLVADFRSRVIPTIGAMARIGPRTGLSRTLWAALDEDAHVARELLDNVVADEKSSEPERVARAAKALRTLHNRLSRLESHFPAPSKVKEEAEKALERRRQDLQQAGVTAEVVEKGAKPCRVDLAPHELDQILDNCVENALRALTGRANARLSIVIIGENQHCIVEVHDNGAGIALPRKEWKRIFERGISTRSITAGEPPGGFGLYRARQVLKRYGGKIEVARSAPGVGTTMRITMRATRRRQASRPAVEKGNAPEATTVLGG